MARSDKGTVIERVRRRLHRGYALARYLLVDKQTLDRPVIETVAGRPLVVLPQVMNPRIFWSGTFLAEALDAHRQMLGLAGARVLDMGTGSGVGAIAAATQGASVIAVDVNPEAVRCARLNALLNRVEERVEVRLGDLFAPVGGERFDLVLFNPPYFRGRPKDAFDAAFRAEDVVERFAAALGEHLAPGGRALVLLASSGDHAGLVAALGEPGHRVDELTRKDLGAEILTLHQVHGAA